MKLSFLSTVPIAVIPALVTLAAVVRHARTRLFAIAMSLATLTPAFGQPVFLVQPQSQLGSLGGNVTFSVVAEGYEPFRYQWGRNGMALAGETNDTLTLKNVQFADDGNYRVVVIDDFGESTMSDVATLTVDTIFTKVTEGPGSDAGYSRGGAWGDYDNDGFIDLFVASFDANTGGSAFHFLYHNNRNGTFSRVTSGVVAAAFTHGAGAVWGDYDNDGYLDLVLMNQNQPNMLFHNSGDGSFAEIPNASIVPDFARHRSVTWVDYDNDGYVDLFITVEPQQPRRLYHNNRDGTFTRITQGGFLTVPYGFWGVAWGDYNNDGRPDLFLPQANEQSGQPNYLYRNDEGGAFTRVAAGMLDGNSNSIAAAWGDYDNDGDLDLFVSCGNFPGPVTSRPNSFYRNDGGGTFTSLTSLPANDPEYQGGSSFGCNWGDYDNDGWLDLFVGNYSGQNNFLYHNNGDGTFTKVLNSLAVTGSGDSRGAAWGDYDNDGFLDLFVGNASKTNSLYHNNGNDNHWIAFRLIGTRSNRSAIGAKVRVRATINGQSFSQMREISGGDGIMGQNSLQVHVGLGDATSADLVRIEWPSGTVQELDNVASKQFLTVTEPGGEPGLAVAEENGQVQLTLTGKQGSRYALENSNALNNWTSANLTVTVTNQNGAVTFPAPGAGGEAQRFFRAVLR